MYVSIAEARRHLSHWLKRMKDELITITQRGKPVGVIIAPEEYERLSNVKAYLDMLHISQRFSAGDDRPTAMELFEASRNELEQRL